MHASSLEAYNCSADSYVHSVVILLSISALLSGLFTCC